MRRRLRARLHASAYHRFRQGRFSEFAAGVSPKAIARGFNTDKTPGPFTDVRMRTAAIEVLRGLVERVAIQPREDGTEIRDQTRLQHREHDARASPTPECYLVE